MEESGCISMTSDLWQFDMIEAMVSQGLFPFQTDNQLKRPMDLKGGGEHQVMSLRHFGLRFRHMRSNMRGFRVVYFHDTLCRD